MGEFLKIKNSIIVTPLFEIIKDIKANIFNGKLKTIRQMGDNIRITCPFHKGGLEERASADIYIGKAKDNLPYGWFKCFTCGTTCSFSHFVASCFEMSDEAAQNWLIENYGDEIDNPVIDLPEIDLSHKSNVYLDESILNSFQDFHPYMVKRKLSKRVIDLFQIKYDPKTQCIVFPVRDNNGRLTMLTRRSVNTKQFIIDKNKEKPLYLLYYMIQHNIQNVMICEGQIDALTAISYGFPCIATMGEISQSQIDSLNKSGIRVLYTMFDNDAAGERFTQKLMNSLRKDILIINVKIPFFGKKDINDLSQDEFYTCVELAENSSNLC